MVSNKLFKVSMHVFCKNHGIGLISDVTEIDVMDEVIKCFEINFETDSIMLTVPEEKMANVGIRHLIPKKIVADVMKVFKDESRGMKVIWSKRSKEYEQKLYSGDIFAIAEVVRDLYKNSQNPSRSYSERVIFEKALERVASEIAVVQERAMDDVIYEINKVLSMYQDIYTDSHVEEVIPAGFIEEIAG